MFIIKYLKSLLYIFISIISFTLLITILSYFNIVSNNIINILEILSIIISMFIGGLYLGKNSSSKGYIQGLKIGGITLSILFLLNYLDFNNSFHLSNLIFYLIVLISLIFGSVFGINKKLKDKA